MDFSPGLALALALLPHSAGPRCTSPDSLTAATALTRAARGELEAFGPGSEEPCFGPDTLSPGDSTIAALPRPEPPGGIALTSGPVLAPRFPTVVLTLPQADTGGRPHASQYSQGYYTRLTIHKYASYATLPLFAAEYIIGEKLYRNDTTASDGLRSAHSAVALAIGGLFAINTVTGGWNFWQSRHDPEGRTRRNLHSLLMFVSDAGFLATAATAPSRERERGGVVIRPPGDKNLHRNLAIASFSTALVGYAMMLIWK